MPNSKGSFGLALTGSGSGTVYYFASYLLLHVIGESVDTRHSSCYNDNSMQEKRAAYG
jgi:hypothetical protein